MRAFFLWFFEVDFLRDADNWARQACVMLGRERMKFGLQSSKGSWNQGGVDEDER